MSNTGVRQLTLCYNLNHFKNKQLSKQREIKWHIDNLQTKHISKNEKQEYKKGP